MRRTFTLLATVTIAVTLGMAGSVSAQGLGRGPALRPLPAPAFSPYLNLLRRETPGYLNYYGLVRPQQDFRQSIVGLRQDVAANQATIQAATGPDGVLIPTTGHRSYFLNTAGYFQSIGGAAGPSGLTPGLGATRPALGGGAGAARPPAGGRR